jgi:hypothetical protein
VTHSARLDLDHGLAGTRIGHIDGHYLDRLTDATSNHSTDLLCHA